jgi:hypothetical protein
MVFRAMGDTDLRKKTGTEISWQTPFLGVKMAAAPPPIDFALVLL